MSKPKSREELEELKVKLLDMRRLGLSASQMATRLGMTRGQVAGQINRLVRGYKSPSQYKALKVAEEKLVEFVPPTSGPRARPSQPATLTDFPILKSDLSFEPLPGKVNVWNVKAGQCRWIDEEGYFCAEATGNPTKSYCAHHHSLCFVPNERRTKRVPTQRPIDTKTLYDRSADDYAFRRSEGRDERQELWAVSGQL